MASPVHECPLVSYVYEERFLVNLRIAGIIGMEGLLMGFNDSGHGIVGNVRALTQWGEMEMSKCTSLRC